jgi:hypothetical protein
MTMPEENNLSCIRCGATMITEPPPSLAHRLRAWFVHGESLHGHIQHRCPGCGAEATTTYFCEGARLPALLRVAQRLQAEQAFVPPPLFHTGAAALGAATGLLARRAGAPRRTPAAGALATTLVVRVWLTASALEPGARWRSLVDAWQDTVDPQALDRSTVRRIRNAGFPFVGVADWHGTRRVGNRVFDERFELTSVELLHEDPDGHQSVSVEITSHPGDTPVELLAEYRRQRSAAQVTITIEDRPVALRRYPPLNEDDHEWAAAGDINGLGIAVQATGFAPEEVDLVIDIDPEPYIAGSQSGLPRED